MPRFRSRLVPAVGLSCLAASGAAVALLPASDPGAAPAPPDAARLIVNLTVDERSLHRADQALTLAGAALGQGREVVVFLNVDAPRLAAGDGSSAGLPGKPPLGEQLRSLIGGGATVFVARGCAGVCGVDLDGLLPGVRPGTAGQVATLAAEGAVVFSY